MNTRSSNFRAAMAVGLVLAGAGAVVGVALAASTGGSSGSSRPEPSQSQSTPDEAQEMFDRGMQLVEEGDYEGARDRFEKAVKKRKDNPDYVNMLAYTQRKTGNLEDAFENYERALGLKPNFPQAREYLGEAHLQAALLQIEALRQLGPSGVKELGELTAAFQRAAATLQAEPNAAASGKLNPKEW
jgi:tetratricopeptide (TPR) repeat protein